MWQEWQGHKPHLIPLKHAGLGAVGALQMDTMKKKVSGLPGKKEVAPSQLGKLGLEGFSRTLSQLT